MTEGVDRREFIKGVGVAVLTIQCLPLIAQARDNEAAEDLIIHSGPGLFAHEHVLLIPYAVLNAPPVQGVELESTKALFHTHRFTLTQEQLTLVNRGGTVTERASSHIFVIERRSHE